MLSYEDMAYNFKNKPRQVLISISYNDSTAAQKSENEGETESEKGESFDVDDIVYFNGGTHYYSSYPGAKGYSAKPGRARITQVDGSGKAHPWYLIHVDNDSNVHGWVDDGAFTPDKEDKKNNVVTEETIEKPRPELGNLIESNASTLTYSDIASGESDSLRIVMHDVEKRWMGPLFPKRGASIGAAIHTFNWMDKKADGKEEVFVCGDFVLDDISFSGAPINCTIGAVSVPQNNDFKSVTKSNTWKSTSLQQIASEIAGRAGVQLVYEAENVPIDELEQNNETDGAFLTSLCSKYDLAIKIYKNKIVIYDINTYESKAAVETIYNTDMLSWTYNTTIDGTYTGVKLSYSDPEKDETVEVTVGKPGRMLYMNIQASSQADAEKQAKAALDAANRNIETLNIKIVGNPKIAASQCVNISGLEKVDGKYFIDKIVHSVGNGYTMQLSLHKVQI